MSQAPLKYLVTLNPRTLPEATSKDYAFKYIDIGQVDSTGGLEIPDEKTVFGEAPSRARRLAPAGATVVSTVRTYLRAIGRVPEYSEPLVFSTGFAVLEAVNVDSRYLTYVCQSSPFVEEVASRSVGVSYPAINGGDLVSIKIWRPADEEQRRIADFLDERVARIDQIIAARREQMVLVRSAAISSMDAAVENAGEERGWAPLRRFMTRIEQGWSPEASANPAGLGEAGVLKLGSVRSGRFLPQENKSFSPETQPREIYRVRRGDLLMTRANTPTLVGDVAVVSREPVPRLYLSDLIYRITLDGYSAPAASACLRTRRTRQTIGVVARGTSGSMPKLRGEDVAGLLVPRIGPDEQEQLARLDDDLLTHAEEATRSIGSSVELLQEYKRSLITAAVTGELDVSTASKRIPGE